MSREMLPFMRLLMDHIGKSVTAFAAVARNRQLRRLELAWAFAINGHWAYTVAVSVYAYKAGGTAAVGLVFAVRLGTAAFIAPLVGVLGDRYPREGILLVSTIIRVLLMAAAAVGVFLEVEPLVVYVLAIATAIATTPFRSSQAALTPSLAGSPEELTAANAVVSTVESLATFLGPAVAGLLLAIASTGVVFTINTLMLVAATFFVAQIWIARAEAATRGETAAREPFFTRMFAGFRAVGQGGPLTVLVTLLTAQTLILGTLQVYLVVIAFKLVDQGAAGVGLLNSAMGIGAIVGGVVMLALTRARRFSLLLAIGVALLGAPLVVLGAQPSFALALVTLGIVGLGSAMLDVAGLTLVQRAVPDELLARVFGVIQMLWYLSLALGAALAPALLDALGTRSSLIITGGSLVVLVAVLWPPLARIDATAAAPDPTHVQLLTSIPIFAPLPAGAVEQLARRLVPLRVEPATVILREGDAGDRFYVVAEGELDVSTDAQMISALRPGEYFGEIALIRDVPRTATVTARTAAVLYALEREDFLEAVLGNPPSANAAETIVSTRLGDTPTVAPAT